MTTLPWNWLADWALIALASLLAAILTIAVSVECTALFLRRRP
jgi:hypothetical protein